MRIELWTVFGVSFLIIGDLQTCSSNQCFEVLTSQTHLLRKCVLEPVCVVMCQYHLSHRKVNCQVCIGVTTCRTGFVGPWVFVATVIFLDCNFVFAAILCITELCAPITSLFSSCMTERSVFYLDCFCQIGKYLETHSMKQ